MWKKATGLSMTTDDSSKWHNLDQNRMEVKHNLDCVAARKTWFCLPGKNTSIPCAFAACGAWEDISISVETCSSGRPKSPSSLSALIFCCLATSARNSSTFICDPATPTNCWFFALRRANCFRNGSVSVKYVSALSFFPFVLFVMYVALWE